MGRAEHAEGMSDLSGPPFRADHVGSLLRPKVLLDARARHAAGEIDDAELRGIEDEAIADVVRMQGDIGLSTATDGEFRRASWHMDFIYAITGINKVAQNIEVHFKNADGTIDYTPAGLHVDGPLSIDEPIFGDDFAYLQSQVQPGQTAKLTIPSPSMVHYRGGAAAIDPAVYPDEDSFWDALSAAYRQQVQGIAAQGCQYLQLDEDHTDRAEDQHAATEDRDGEEREHGEDDPAGPGDDGPLRHADQYPPAPCAPGRQPSAAGTTAGGGAGMLRACPTSPALRSALTTSVACSAPGRSSTPAPGTPQGSSTTRSSAASRTRRSPTSCACRATSACRRRPTASSAAPPGTWTSSTRSTGSARSRRTSR
ncbi:MAG: Methionine synthase vitamin-B12 independent, partial [Modestobacter sp.]|nr:Methionine synthase vitamin-B12 independent [Modestobacter sp.]